MHNTLRSVGSGLFGLIALASSAWAQGGTTFEGVVRDPKGQPVKGAEVRVETKDERVISKGKTDAKGHYVTKPVAAGVYKVDLVIDSITKATLANAKTNKSGATQLNFDIKASPQKKRVWLQETGSHMGRWVEVDDPNSAVSANNVSRGTSTTLRNMQEKAGTASLPGGN